MRVAYVLLRPPSYSETFIEAEIRSVRAAGATVEVFVAGRGGGRLTEADRVIRTLIRRPRRLLGHVRTLGASDVPRALLAGSYAIALSERVAAFAPDVVHTHFVNLPTAVAALVAGDLGVPATAMAHAADFLLDRDPIGLDRRLGLLGHLFVISAAAARQLAAKGAAMSRIPHGIVRAAFDGAILDRRPREQGGPTRIVTVARLVAKKGIDTGIDAVARLAAAGRDVRYDIYGDGPLRQSLERRVEKQGGAAVVTFHGAAPHQTAMAALAGADVAVLACRRGADGDLDGIPVFLMEAASRHVPVVTTAVSGIPDLLGEDGGWLVPPDDPAALADAISHAMRDPRESRRRARALGARLTAEFSPALQAERLLATWRRLAGPSDVGRLRGEAPMQPIDRRRFNAGLLLGFGFAGSARPGQDLVVNGGVLELDQTKDALEVPVSMNGAPGLRETIGAVSGGGNLLRDEAGSHKIADLVALHGGIARVSAASPKNDYFRGNAPSPERFDDVMLALLQEGVQPYLSFVFTDEMDSSKTGIPARNYADWFAIGAAFAGRFRKNSPFLVSQGIAELGTYGYAAINEPDHDEGEAAGLTYTQYHDMLKGLADGVHSVDPDGKVWPGGYLSHDRDGEFTGHGYCIAIADLINDGTLEGFDLHTYHSGRNSPATYANAHQFAVDAFIARCGITRADVNPICTETNVQADPVARKQGYGEETARKWFLTAMIDVLGTVRPDESWAVGPRLPWNLWDQSAEQFHMASRLVPRTERWCGHTYKMLLDLLWDMRFTFNDPRGTGVHKLKGGGKSAWCFQNIDASWSTLFGASFTIDDIPAAATKVDVYDGMGLIETVDRPGTNHVFSTPTGKSYLFVADAE